MSPPGTVASSSATTVTPHFAVAPLYSAEMVASPTATAVTSPSSTVATDSSELDHAMLPDTLAASLKVSPSISSMLFCESSMSGESRLHALVNTNSAAARTVSAVSATLCLNLLIFFIPYILHTGNARVPETLQKKSAP